MDLDESAGRIKFLIRECDVLDPPQLEHLLSDAGIGTVRRAVRAPRMNAIMERRIGSCRRELLDRTLVWNLPHLRRILRDYETHYDAHRPHNGPRRRSTGQATALEVADLDAFRVDAAFESCCSMTHGHSVRGAFPGVAARLLAGKLRFGN
jgi:hypothetical protein